MKRLRIILQREEVFSKISKHLFKGIILTGEERREILNPIEEQCGMCCRYQDLHCWNILRLKIVEFFQYQVKILYNQSVPERHICLNVGFSDHIYHGSKTFAYFQRQSTRNYYSMTQMHKLEKMDNLDSTKIGKFVH